MTWISSGMKDWSMNPQPRISKVSNKTAENTLSLHTHAHSTTPAVWSSLCSVQLISFASHWQDPIQRPQWLDESRPGCMPQEDFWDQWISSPISVRLGGSNFCSEQDFWPRSLFGSIYGRHVATAKSKPRHEFSLCVHSPSKPHQPKKRFITIVVSIDEMAVIWTLSTWHFE